MEILLKPIYFFRFNANKKVIFLKSMIVVLCNAVLTGLMAYLIGSTKLNISAKIGALIIGLTISLTIGVMKWILEAGLFHVIAVASKSKGSYRKYVEFMGYAHLPLTLYSLFAVVLVIIFNGKINIPANINMLNPSNTIPIQADPIMTVIKTLGFPFQIWNIILAVCATKFVYNVSYKKAALIIVAPTSLIVLVALLIKAFL